MLSRRCFGSTIHWISVVAHTHGRVATRNQGDDMNGNNVIWTIVGVLLICVLILLLTGRMAL
jgi:hypothetical protein